MYGSLGLAYSFLSLFLVWPCSVLRTFNMSKNLSMNITNVCCCRASIAIGQKEWQTVSLSLSGQNWWMESYKYHCHSVLSPCGGTTAGTRLQPVSMAPSAAWMWLLVSHSIAWERQALETKMTHGSDETSLCHLSSSSRSKEVCPVICGNDGTSIFTHY